VLSVDCLDLSEEKVLSATAVMQVGLVFVCRFVDLNDSGVVSLLFCGFIFLHSSIKLFIRD